MGEALVREDPARGEGLGALAETADSPSTSPQLRVEGFEGPLDFLLEMVRRQRVDLGPLSILTLTDQLVGAIENSGGGVRLERRADWLIMASQLLLLKAQLLVPASPAAAEEAQEEARRRLEQLDGLARMQAGADWLAARAQLGQEVFPRGQSAPPVPRPQAELYVAFLEATLALLESQEGQGGGGARHLPPRAARPLAHRGRRAPHHRTARAEPGRPSSRALPAADPECRPQQAAAPSSRPRQHPRRRAGTGAGW